MRTLTTRTFTTSTATHQARQKLKPTTTIHPPPRRPAFEHNNPYLPTTNLVGAGTQPIKPEEATAFPILIPHPALDPVLTKKLANDTNSLSPEESLIVKQVRIDGQNQLNKVVEEWVRNELNVMGTIREETIQIFMKLLLHPSTLAPLAEKMQLRTAGRRATIKASLHAPKRVVPASSVADEELTQLLHYLIGSIHRSLSQSEGASNVRLKRYIIELLTTGLTHTSARQLLLRATQLSGQSIIGNKTGHARAELRVAQLHIWGARRDKKIRKLVPDQVPHRTPQRLRKAQLLKQRWLREEALMVHWRNRLLKVSAIQENEAISEKLRRAEHAEKVKQWNQGRRQLQLQQQQQAQTNSTSNHSIFSKLFNFWPFSSSSTGLNPSTPKSSS
ncbi:hypothetical protein PGT21_006597 [Puccinia graminis f. sp. tritici]|uniref:Uncharacterized protein n=1 Tax=Puccinia graminis f. sp. tritici TaxID=56615 RepID=A0A5B0LN80_PUCGR|nr:hypothetical protein PGT21_006597 [Puccinia graminis f. sp. tritici]KAA1129874.1 hypothetical protein PGTUg99_005215 [Puccinia graminis f. sp. tritici]